MSDMKELILDPRIKLFGEDLGSNVVHMYPFDCSPIDISYGGGIAAGKMYECFAWESMGKSTLALEACKAFSNYWTAKGKEHIIVWQECESALDQVRAAYMGCSVKRFLVSETETLESMEEIIKLYCDKSLKTGIKVFYVVDTTAALQTHNELHPKQNKDGSENKYSGGMMEKPRVFKSILRNLVQPLGKSDGTLFMCNQLYSGGPFSEDEAPGGGGPKFYCSVRTSLKQTGLDQITLKDGTIKVVGIRTTLFHKKNKLTLPKQKVEVVIKGETGIDKFETVFNYLVANKLIESAGGWKYLTSPVKVGYLDKDKLNEKGEPTYVEPVMEKTNFQSPDKLKELIQVKYPLAPEWMDYLVYRHHIASSPLIKIKIINKIWDYEIKFYGRKLTELNQKELDAAAVLSKIVQDEETVTKK